MKGRRGETAAKGKENPIARAPDFYGQMNSHRPQILKAYSIRTFLYMVSDIWCLIELLMVRFFEYKVGWFSPKTLIIGFF